MSRVSSTSAQAGFGAGGGGGGGGAGSHSELAMARGHRRSWGGGSGAARWRQHEDDSTRSPAAVKPTGVMHRPPPGALAHVGFGLWWPHAGAIHDVLTWKHHV